jgi:hypothetical protein
MTYSDVFHGTINKTGLWFTGTLHGSVEFVPDDPAAVTYSGHFAAWFGDENNLRNDVEHSTFNAHLTGTDGTTVDIHDNTQATLNAKASSRSPSTTCSSSAADSGRRGTRRAIPLGLARVHLSRQLGPTVTPRAGGANASRRSLCSSWACSGVSHRPTGDEVRVCRGLLGEVDLDAVDRTELSLDARVP